MRTFLVLAFAVLTSLLSCCPSAYGLDCSSQQALQLQMQNECLSMLDHSLTLNPSGQLDILGSNLEQTCRISDTIKAALSCAMNISANCLATVNQSSDILPDVSKMVQGITYVCDHMQNIDVQCALKYQAVMEQCAINTAKSAFDGNTTTDTVYIVCKSLSISMACQLEVLPRCGCGTVQVYSNYTKNYLNPPACSPIQYSVPECHPADPVQFSPDPVQFSPDSVQSFSDSSFGVAVRSSGALFVMFALLTSLLHSLH